MLKKRIAKNKTPAKKEKSFFVSVFIGTMVSLVIGGALLTLFSFIGLSVPEVTAKLPVFSLLSLFITALSAGYIAAKNHLKSGLACGALAGIFLIGILVLLVFAFDFTIRPTLFMICAPSAVVCSMIAGVAGVTAKPKKRVHKKK